MCGEGCFYLMQINLILTDRRFMFKQHNPLCRKRPGPGENLYNELHLSCIFKMPHSFQKPEQLIDQMYIYYALLMCQAKHRLGPGKSCLFHNTLINQGDYQHFRSPPLPP